MTMHGNRMNHARPGGALSGGFTLIELMITVGIVAILATIAAAAYTSEVQKSRRTDARTALMDLAGREEKLFSVTNAYTSSLSTLGYAAGAAASVVVGSGYYSVTVASPDTVNQPGVTNSYLITATAIGAQASDTSCSTLTVNQLGVQGSTGTASAATCWGN